MNDSYGIKDLQEKVRKNTDAIKSALDLIKGLKAKLDEAAGPDVKDTDIRAEVEALAAEIDAQSDLLAQAVVENTDADSGSSGGGSGDSGGSIPEAPEPDDGAGSFPAPSDEGMTDDGAPAPDSGSSDGGPSSDFENPDMAPKESKE